MKDPLAVYVPANRTKLLLVAGLLVVAIAVVDWKTTPYLPLGFLYLFPMIIVGGFLSRIQIVGIALLCALLQEIFSNLPTESEAIIRLILSSFGFAATGLLISELIRNRRIVFQQLEELERQVKLREDAEGQLRTLVESSPAAIVTVDSDGKVLLANEAAQQLLASGPMPPLPGCPIRSYLPALETVLKTQSSRSFRTT